MLIWPSGQEPLGQSQAAFPAVATDGDPGRRSILHSFNCTGSDLDIHLELAPVDSSAKGEGLPLPLLHIWWTSSYPERQKLGSLRNWLSEQSKRSKGPGGKIWPGASGVTL